MSQEDLCCQHPIHTRLVFATRKWLELAGSGREITRTALRYTFPQELAALLHYNGFTIARRYSDWKASR